MASILRRLHISRTADFPAGSFCELAVFDLASFSRCRFENNVSFERRPVGDYRDEPGPQDRDSEAEQLLRGDEPPQDATFLKSADFSCAIFSSDVSFGMGDNPYTRYLTDLPCPGAEIEAPRQCVPYFGGTADFGCAQFHGAAHFNHCEFAKGISFHPPSAEDFPSQASPVSRNSIPPRTIFHREAIFSNTYFTDLSGPSFESVSFEGLFDFRGAITPDALPPELLEPQGESKPIEFNYCSFRAATRFDRPSRARVSFSHCDILAPESFTLPNDPNMIQWDDYTQESYGYNRHDRAATAADNTSATSPVRRRGPRRR